MNEIVRTFRAADPRSALDAVRNALGDEAVILKTREVGGLWGKRQVEITAAGSRESLALPTGPAPDLEKEVMALRRIVDELRSEVRSKGAEPRMTGMQARGDNLPAPVPATARKLMQRGAEQAIAEEIARDAARAAGGPGERDALASLRDTLRRRLSPSQPPWDGQQRRLVALVGPPGVGKTTTIAKIAARALLESRLKVSLITVDTYRIGASEHIERYGEIMGVPTHVARDGAGLRAAVAASQDAQLILIDTAGRSHPAALEAQRELLRAVPDAELHLVLSAATGARELRAATLRFKSRGISRFIFTKLDEADGPASVLSALQEIPGCPVSCVADGQRVPDDLHAATGPLLCEIVLGKGA